MGSLKLYVLLSVSLVFLISVDLVNFFMEGWWSELWLVIFLEVHVNCQAMESGDGGFIEEAKEDLSSDKG